MCADCVYCDACSKFLKATPSQARTGMTRHPGFAFVPVSRRMRKERDTSGE